MKNFLFGFFALCIFILTPVQALESIAPIKRPESDKSNTAAITAARLLGSEFNRICVESRADPEFLKREAMVKGWSKIEEFGSQNQNSHAWYRDIRIITRDWDRKFPVIVQFNENEGVKQCAFQQDWLPVEFTETFLKTERYQFLDKRWQVSNDETTRAKSYCLANPPIGASGHQIHLLYRKSTNSVQVVAVFDFGDGESGCPLPLDRYNGTTTWFDLSKKLQGLQENPPISPEVIIPHEPPLFDIH